MPSLNCRSRKSSGVPGRFTSLKNHRTQYFVHGQTSSCRTTKPTNPTHAMTGTAIFSAVGQHASLPLSRPLQSSPPLYSTVLTIHKNKKVRNLHTIHTISTDKILNGVNDCFVRLCCKDFTDLADLIRLLLTDVFTARAPVTAIAVQFLLYKKHVRLGLYGTVSCRLHYFVHRY